MRSMNWGCARRRAGSADSMGTFVEGLEHVLGCAHAILAVIHDSLDSGHEGLHGTGQQCAMQQQHANGGTGALIAFGVPIQRQCDV